jgi:hypothetical protein
MDDIEGKIERYAQVIAKQMPLSSDFITIVEAAPILRKSLGTARRLQAAGLMPPRRKFIRTWKYLRSDVVKLRDSTNRCARGQKT